MTTWNPRQERKIKAKNLQLGQYIWYAMQWREIMSVVTANHTAPVPSTVVVVRFRGDVGDTVTLNGEDIYEVKGML